MLYDKRKWEQYQCSVFAYFFTLKGCNMYGYIVVNKQELKFREYDECRSYYCGLCEVLKKEYGRLGQISISYDMLFLILLLTGLYEPETTFYKSRCMIHPLEKHQVRRNSITEYVADMNILMTYYKCVDDWNDDRKVTKKIFADGIEGKVKKVISKYPDKAKPIQESLSRLNELEKENITNIDEASACFGEVMAQMTAMKDDEWKEQLQRLGYSLGKFIYILDAYEDVEDDIKKNRYNCLKEYFNKPGFDEFCGNVLRAIMADCAASFEMLPIIENAAILRNILYSGVWTRFEIVGKKRRKQENKSD